MRPIAFAALISIALAAFGPATPALGQTVTAPVRPAGAAGMTVRDGSDAGPSTQPVVPDSAQADDANSLDSANLADLPRIATHAPTPLGRPAPSGDAQ